MSESLTKETILSKLNNFLVWFRFDMTWKYFDDYQRKYLNTIIKLDNSKTIILETKWDEVKVKNLWEVKLKKWLKYNIEFSNLQEESKDTVFVNYQYLHEVPIDTEITFEDSKAILKVTQNEDWVLECIVEKMWNVSSGKKLKFLNYKPRLSFLSEKDKRDIIWWLKSGVNMLIASAVKTADDIKSIKDFLNENEWEGLKIIVRLHTKSAYENLDDIIDNCDWILMKHQNVSDFADWNETSFDILEKVKRKWKPFYCCIEKKLRSQWWTKVQKILEEYINLWLDAFVVNDNIVDWKDFQDTLIKISNEVNAFEIKNIELERRKIFFEQSKSQEHVQHYLIHKALKITSEIPVKAIICYTDTWEMVTKLWALRPTIPLIVFTKNDYVFRYINTLRGVKWYKISKNFSYESFKSLWKEMIRILFKWNISLDDKILIIQVREENIEEEKISNWINGIELYKFKDI